MLHGSMFSYDMPYARKLILHAPPWDSPLLEKFVDQCLRDHVDLICVVGHDCGRVHDVIDEIVVGIDLGIIVVGDGASRSIGGDRPTTTWHPDETLAEVRAFAEAFGVDGDTRPQIQELTLRSD